MTLSATSFDYVGDWFLQSDGNITSDHNPVNVNFTWSLGDTLRVTDYYGGPHGDYYSDLPQLSSLSSSSGAGAGATPAVANVTLRGASRLDAITFVLTDGTTFSHGGTGGTASSLSLASGETIASAYVCQDKYNDETRIFYAKLTTSAGRTVAAGTTTDECVTLSAENGWEIVGAVGRSGDEVDRVAFVYAK